MSERDSLIIELTKSGLSARKIRERLKLEITVRSIQRVQYKYLGAVPNNRNGALHQISDYFMPYVVECLRQLGKDPYLCEICSEPQKRQCMVHHTKYDGVTIFDLQYVCGSCNLARVNIGLA